MAKLFDQRFLLFKNDKFVKAQKADGSNLDLFKVSATDKWEFSIAPEIGGSALQTELQVDAKVSTETMRATGVESGLDSRLVTAEGEINVLQSDVDAVELALANEIMRATGIESGIDSRLVIAEGEINVIQSDLDANELALANEIMRATGIESGIDSRLITAEGEINVLQSDLDANELALSNEAMARVAGDAAVEAIIVSQVSMLSTQITNGDNSSVASANMYTDTALSGEANQRQLGDAALQAQIDAISGGGSGSLAALQTELDATQVELVALQAEVSNVVSNIDPTSLDSLTEIVSAFQSADSNLNGAITSLASSASSGLSAETAARIAADDDIMSEVSTNSTISNDRWTATQAADAALQVQVTATNDALSAETARAIDAEELNADNISAEQTRATNAEIALGGRIDSEEARAIVSENALSGRVTVLESVVWVKESFSITNGQTSVTLAFSPKGNSASGFIDRLAIHESEDFTISGNVVTFINDLVSPGQSQIGSGDTIYFKYQK